MRLLVLAALTVLAAAASIGSRAAVSAGSECQRNAPVEYQRGWRLAGHSFVSAWRGLGNDCAQIQSVAAAIAVCVCVCAHLKNRRHVPMTPSRAHG